jgi:hypothetical protein
MRLIVSILILLFFAGSSAAVDPLSNNFYEDPKDSISAKMDKIIKLGEEAVNKATPLSDFDKELALQKRDIQYLEQRSKSYEEFMKDQITFNRSLAEGIAVCIESVKGLKGNWDKFFGLIGGVVLALLAWLLEKKGLLRRKK